MKMNGGKGYASGWPISREYYALPPGLYGGGGSQCEEEDQVQRQEVGFPARSDLASSSCPFIWEEAEEQKDWEE